MRTSIQIGIATALLILSPRMVPAVSPTADELATAHNWMAARFAGDEKAKAAEPFFSFKYDGKPSAEFLDKWDLKRSSRKLDDNRVEHTLTFTDPKTKLIVRCVGVEYLDYPCVEWTLHFKNAGERDTPILSDIQALDMKIDRQPPPGAKKPVYLLHHSAGGLATPAAYQPQETFLGPSIEKRVRSVGGRPTDGDFCYFNLELARDEGLIIAVGWPGQWAGRFVRDKASLLQIQLGQELTHFKLLPGEEVRSPLVALQFWTGGDWLRAQNVWRRWFIAHNLRRPGGKLPTIQWCGSAGAYTSMMVKATEENLKPAIDAYAKLGLKPDFWWMDAGWYPCRGLWSNTGTWEVDKTRFPNGLRAVTDYLHARDIRALLWFEPERVRPDTWLAKNHPEWLLGKENNKLLNLGDPKAWRWAVDMVDKILTSEKIDIFRLDFNMRPLGCWRGNDAKDRQGITEIRHVEGLLAFWDELLRRHPNVLYDNCASGGRRNDLESMRRGVPFTKSDYAVMPVGVQSQTYGISLWLPYFAGSFGTFDDPYTFRSNIAPVIGGSLDPKDKNQFKQLAKRLDEWRKTTANYWGDFWPLTPHSTDDRAWIAWQFDCPEKGEGVVQAFRRAESDFETARFRLRGLEPNVVYCLTDLDADGSFKMTGRELMEAGLPVAMKTRPSASIITYKKNTSQ